MSGQEMIGQELRDTHLLLSNVLRVTRKEAEDLRNGHPGLLGLTHDLLKAL